MTKAEASDSLRPLFPLGMPLDQAWLNVGEQQAWGRDRVLWIPGAWGWVLTPCLSFLLCPTHSCNDHTGIML